MALQNSSEKVFSSSEVEEKDLGLDLVLHSARSGTLRPNVLTDFGIDLGGKLAVV